MDIIFWVIPIAVIAAVVWWLVNRNKSGRSAGGASAAAAPERPRADGALEGGSAAASAAAAGTTGIPTAAGFGKPAEPAAPATAEEPADSAADSVPAAPASTPPAAETPTEVPTEATGGAEHRASGPGVDGGAPAHHDEYTAAHAPTLPGAETAAVESLDDAGTPPGATASRPAPQHRAESTGAATDHGQASTASAGRPMDVGTAETLERTQSSGLVENAADHHQPSGQEQDGAEAPVQSFAPVQGTPAAEPAGHLAAQEPYGAGSAAAAADGSGPADYTVKGDAGAMVYYEEGHPEYEQTRAEVWFESAAHAEAAGFRAPRRKRL